MIYNDSQKKAVMHTTGPMMVLAGPGSGKTAVITGRTCQLVKSGISASLQASAQKRKASLAARARQKGDVQHG